MKFDRNTLLLVIVIAASLTLLFTINLEAPSPVTQVNKETTNLPASNISTFVSKENVCEGCHMSGKPFIPQAMVVKPHINGGAYCLTCHKISHERHPINQNVTCEKCHGAQPSTPVYVNGTISCNNCHNYPDPLAPSNGNLITIHRPRGITCNTCHTNTCTKCHLEMGTSQRWEKRLDHFKAMPVS